ncbi:TIGR00725 family protein [bacterium]|nr:TIGR00725 family protein [bacterium]
MRKVQISVIGGSSCDRATKERAEAVGRLLAEAGATLVCGGYGGVMEAACRGAKSAGGQTVGILIGYDHAEANPWCDVVIPTGMGLARNALVVASGQAVIAIDGRYGTLSEIALALNLNRPVVSLNSWGFGDENREVLPPPLKPRNFPEGRLHYASSPEEAVELALRLAREA